MVAGIVLAFSLAGAAAAGLPIIVSADQEAEAVNPGHAWHRTPAEIKADEDFRTTMDRVFGPGRWRQTSGYRTRAQEDALRRAGAGTVAAGHLSKHSIGNWEKPGAYDAVVRDMSLQAAAEKLRRAGGDGFSRVLAEGAHGGQGPHLHVELILADAR
jgi:uncharacterized protein YjeT (DUF2065 family)